MISPGDIVSIPLADWVDSFVKDWLAPNFRPFFHALRLPIQSVLNGLNDILDAIPMLVFAGGLAIIAWITAGVGVAIFTIVSLSFIDMIDLWSETITTFAMVVTAVIFCVVVGVPIGIAAARAATASCRSCGRSSTSCRRSRPSFISFRS